jgi:DNA helicase-2/ATP-dependent DNA helicase PcrA
MITIDRFYQAYQSFKGYPIDAEQREIIKESFDKPLYVVAGPGTGKTTAITLRILKLILIDGLIPENILATTFTNKAAEELRSRILGWGNKIFVDILNDKGTSKKDKEILASLDLNQVITGTIDSICERLATEYRQAGVAPPVLADDYVSKTLMLRFGLLNHGRYANGELGAVLLNLHDGGGNRFGFNVGGKNDLLFSIWERRYQDMVDWDSFKGTNIGGIIDEAHEDYLKALQGKNLIDYSLLEYRIFDQLSKGQLKDFTDKLKVIFVDEYQDTNLLQESIYFELAKRVQGAINVVGDDDQSLYRFRGATVDLFSNYEKRYEKRFKRKPQKLFLKNNYRSTKDIVDFINDYVKLDKTYQEVRVISKPKLKENKKAGTPVLAMVRGDIGMLSRDLSSFIEQVFRGSGYRLQDGTIIKKDPKGGNLGDCALLSSSPLEVSGGGNLRLPGLLRRDLGQRRINVFNPRGQELIDMQIIQQFGGLLLNCLDPDETVTNANARSIGNEIILVFQQWRAEAGQFLIQGAHKGLIDYVDGWVNRDPKRKGYRWPPTVPVIDLVYGIRHYFPDLINNPEGQLYLEVFTRQLTACAQVSGFEGRLVFDHKNPGLSDKSIRDALVNFLAPIAAGSVKVNEDLVESFPRDRFSILSIHQSKGLEFPLLIVDCGSDFRINHHAHRFKRHPVTGGPTHRLEDFLREFSDLTISKRSQVDRAFDDLFRQYFVAYSRPEDVLLLVGVDNAFPGTQVLNVATGDDRNGKNHWLGAEPYLNI